MRVDIGAHRGHHNLDFRRMKKGARVLITPTRLGRRDESHPLPSVIVTRPAPSVYSAVADCGFRINSRPIRIPQSAITEWEDVYHERSVDADPAAAIHRGRVHCRTHHCGEPRPR